MKEKNKKPVEVRTWEDFVEELVSVRTVKQICAIASATRWSPFLPEIKAHAKHLKEIRKKIKINR